MTAFAKPRGLPDQRHKCDWLLDLKVCVGGGGRGHGLLGGGAWPVGGGIPEAIGDGWVTYLVVQGCHNTVGCPHGVRGQLSHCSLQHGCNNMCSAV
jgi:hypothetical protein